MKKTKLARLATVFFTAVCMVLNTFSAYAVNVVTSADFASNWNSGISPIIVIGAQLDAAGNYGISMANSLNAFGGADMSLDSYSGTPDGTALLMNQYTLAFSPGWNNDMSASISNLSIYAATNGAVSFLGNGVGAHIFTIDGTYFYGNITAGSTGGAVNIQSQMQSASTNSYTLTDNDFISNQAMNGGGAVYMASNNSYYSGGSPNVFSVIDDTGSNSHYISLNQAGGGVTDSGKGNSGQNSGNDASKKMTIANGGGIYFMANNADGGNVINEFTAQGYTYYQNYATGMGGAIYNGVLNGNNPAVNNFNITSGTFAQNQAGSGGGGAIANEINGGNTTVNFNINGSFYSNLTSGNGGAIANLVGGQYSPYGGTITFNIEGPFDSNKAANGGAIYNNIQAGQANVVINISSSITNNYASGNGGAIYNTAGNNNPGTAAVNIADGTNFYGNGANYGGAIYNAGNGVINFNTVNSSSGGFGISFQNNYAGASTQGPDIYQSSPTAVINIAGDGQVNIFGGFGGTGTINQAAGTTLYLDGASESFGYTGVFNQAFGATLDSSGQMFGGANNFGGTANITSIAVNFYFNANMLDNSVMNYTANSVGRTSVGAATGAGTPGISFAGTGATINFGTNQLQGLYLLQNDISNGQANTINFGNSDVTFGSTDYTGGTTYNFFNNSVLDLANSAPNVNEYNQYTFGSLNAPDGTTLLSFKIGNDLTSTQTDTINVLTGSGAVGLGKIYVNDSNGVITGQYRIIYGNAVDWTANGLTQYVATSTGTYTLTTISDQYINFSSIGVGISTGTTSTVDPGGGTTTTTDNPSGGTTTTTTDPNGGATTTTDDGSGNSTTTTTNPDGGSSTTNSGSGGTTSSSTTDPNGGTTTTITNPGGDTTTTTTNPDGSTSVTNTDPGSNTTGSSTTDPNGGTTTTITNPGGDTTTTTTSPDGGTSVTNSGSGGNTTSTTTTNPDGSTTTTIIDSDGSTASNTTNANGSTNTTYNDNNGSGTITVTTNPDGSTTISSTDPNVPSGTISPGGSGSYTTEDGGTITIAPGAGGSITTTVTTPDGGSSTVTSNPGTGGSSSSTTDSSGNTIDTTTGSDGSSTTTGTPAGGGSTTTTTPAGGTGGSSSSTTDSSGNTIDTTTGSDGSSTTTGTPAGGGSTTTTTTPGGTGGSSSSSTDSGGNTIDTSTGSGSSTTTVTTPGGGSTTTTTPGDGSGNTTTTVTTPDGSGGSSTTTTTTNPDGSGSSVTNPNGSTAGTTVNNGGATGTVTTPPPTTPTVLVLNDVNDIDSAAISVGISSATPRAYQIGAGEIYYNDMDLSVMAEGVFSVYGADKTTSTLSGLNLSDVAAGSSTVRHQSLFNIANSSPTFFTLEDLTIQDAYSAVGGAVINMSNPNSTVSVTKLLVQNNHSDGDGGVFNVTAGVMTGWGIDYDHNTSSGNGGAVYNTSSITKHGGSFTNNYAAGNGGAVYNDAQDPNNMLTICAGAGGDYVTPLGTFSGMLITGNKAGGLGGAIYNAAGSYMSMASITGADVVLDENYSNWDSTAGTGTRNDIYNEGILDFTSTGGSWYVGGGFAGSGTINKYSPVVLHFAATSDNSNFTGDFNQYNGIVNVNAPFFGGKSTIASGILNWNAGAVRPAAALLQVISGTINIYGSLILNHQYDIIGPASTLNLFPGGYYEIAGGTVFLNTTDMLVTPQGTYGTASMSDGYLVIGGADMLVYSGAFEQTGGVIRVENQATAHLNYNLPGSGIFGGDIVLTNATLYAQNYIIDYGPGIHSDGSGTVQTSGSLAMGDNAIFNSIDGAIQTHNFAGCFGLFSVMSSSVQTTANFMVDVDARACKSDTLVFAQGSAVIGSTAPFIYGNGVNDPSHPEFTVNDVYATGGFIMLEDINLLNTPRTAVVPFTIIDPPVSPFSDPRLIFVATDKKYDTAVGTYGLYSTGIGNYELRLLGINPAALRGQAALFAMLEGQFTANSVLFDHVFFDSNQMLVDEYKYEYKFLPRQFFKENREKSYWVKTYYEYERLPVADNTDLKNNLYGAIFGLDFAAKDIGDNSYFMPSLFVGYTGQSQSLASATMNQNAVRAGFMASVMVNDVYTASALVYGGGYRNNMEVSGSGEDLYGFFTGAAVKNAYNMYMNNFVLQPFAMASYNFYGAQSWTSSYGNIEMETDCLNGFNLSPGANLIYALDTWNFLAGGAYVYNLGDRATGRIGSIELPAFNTGIGYFEWTAGASKIFSKKLSVWLKGVYKTNRDSDIGVKAGAGWRF